ncbi:MAG: 4-hydroxybenzoate octaprenyltransferase [Pseudomonadota bacterium]
MGHTDIKSEGWVAKLPKAIQPYALLMRLDRPVGWWLLLIPSWWGIALGQYHAPQPREEIFLLGLLFFVGAILMRGAGCIINDLWDRNLDQKVERTKSRPLASGAVIKKQALIFLSVLLTLSFFILVQLSIATITIGMLSMLLVITYPLMKRITWWPQFFLGITFNVGVLMGYAAVAGGLSIEAWILYVAAVSWTLGYDTIYALQDKEDDALVGIKSTARLFGNKVRAWVGVFYTLHIGLFALALLKLNAGLAPFIILALPLIDFFWQLQKLKTPTPENALKIFKSNVITGLVLLVVLIAGLL